MTLWWRRSWSWMTSAQRGCSCSASLQKETTDNYIHAETVTVPTHICTLQTPGPTTRCPSDTPTWPPWTCSRWRRRTPRTDRRSRWPRCCRTWSRPRRTTRSTASVEGRRDKMILHVLSFCDVVYGLIGVNNNKWLNRVAVQYTHFDEHGTPQLFWYQCPTIFPWILISMSHLMSQLSCPGFPLVTHENPLD